MVFAHVKDSPNRRGVAAIPSISSPAHRLAAFLHKSSTGSCTERMDQRPSPGAAAADRACHGEHGGSAALAGRGNRGPACLCEPGRPAAAVSGQFTHGPCAGCATRTMFSPSTTAVSRCCAWFRDRHRGLDHQPAGSLARGQPRSRGSEPYGQACCDALGPRCQTQGGRCEPYSSRRPCPA